jgi:outer membrane protein assembly factor BamA
MTYNFISGSYNYQINTLDTKYFPDRGMLFNLTAGTSKPVSGIVSSESGRVSYNEADPGTFSFKRAYSLNGGLKQYYTAWEKITLSVRGDFLFTYDADTVTSLHNLNYLGGIESLSLKSIPLIGFHSYEVAVNKFIGAGADLDFEVFKDVHLTLMTGIFAARENPDDEKVSLFSGFGLGVGYMSIIGPMKIGIMNGLSNNNNYTNAIKGYISIGYRF